MASSDRRGKLKIETCLKSDRLEIVVHEAEGLRNTFDKSEAQFRANRLNQSEFVKNKLKSNGCKWIIRSLYQR